MHAGPNARLAGLLRSRARPTKRAGRGPTASTWQASGLGFTIQSAVDRSCASYVHDPLVIGGHLPRSNQSALAGPSWAAPSCAGPVQAARALLCQTLMGWAFMGPPGPLGARPSWAPLGPYGQGPHVIDRAHMAAPLLAHMGRALMGPPGHLWPGLLWARPSWPPLGPYGQGPYGPPGPLWAGPIWAAPLWPPWTLMGRAFMGQAFMGYLGQPGPYGPIPYGPPWALMRRACIC